jgi:hypothetical protein
MVAKINREREERLRPIMVSMTRNSYLIFSIGYKAIYGSNGLTFDEIKKELGRFDLNSMFELSAKIGVILFNTAGDVSQLQNGQVNLYGLPAVASPSSSSACPLSSRPCCSM